MAYNLRDSNTMERYSLLQINKRAFKRMSFIPNELEIFWSLLFGAWVAVILSQDLMVPNYSISQNLGFLSVILVIIVAWFCIMTHQFECGFNDGSFRSYFVALWVSLAASLALALCYFRTINLPEVAPLIESTLSRWWLLLFLLPAWLGIHILTIVVSFETFRDTFSDTKSLRMKTKRISVLSSLFFILRDAFRDKDNRKAKIKEMLVLSSLILSFFFIGHWLVVRWHDLIEWIKLNEYLSILEKNQKSLSGHNFKIIMIILLNVLVFLRILLMEGHYLLTRDWRKQA
jgi:hypothetical protein